MNFLFVLMIALCSCTTLRAQIDSWTVIADPVVVLAPFQDDSTNPYVGGIPVVYRDNTIAICAGRSYRPVGATTNATQLLFVESTDAGQTWRVICRFDGVFGSGAAVSFGSYGLHYVADGSLVLHTNRGFLKCDRDLGTCRLVWSNLQINSTLTALAHSSVDFLRTETGVVMVDPVADTLINLGECTGCEGTPANALFRHGWRRLTDNPTADVQYKLGNQSSGTYTPPVWSSTLGVCISGASIGDDNGRTWDGGPLTHLNDAHRPFAITENGTLVRFVWDNTSAKIVMVSSDLGITWQPSEIPIPDSWFFEERALPVVNRFGSELYVYGEYGNVLLRANTNRTIPNVQRWPRNASADRPDVQTLICPASLDGEIEVQLDKSSSFSSPIVSRIVATRYTTVEDLEPRTTYVWRYRHRPSATDAWGLWSDTWSFSTGACTFWRHLTGSSSDSGKFHYYRMLDGTFVRGGEKHKKVYISRDDTRTWDTICTLTEMPDKFYETPGGRLFVHAKKKWYHVDLTTGQQTPVVGGDLDMFTGTSSNAMFARAGNDACMSTDDGSTWTVLHNWTWEGINSVLLEQDGTVIFGVGYFTNDPPNGPREYIGGAQRYDPISNAMTQIAPHVLPWVPASMPAYIWLQRNIDGALYCSHDSTLWKSRDNTASWTVMPMEGDLKLPTGLGTMWTDRDANMMIALNTGGYRRRFESTWERIDNGIFFRDAFQTVIFRSGADPTITPLRDGSALLHLRDQTWILERDVTTRYLKPLAHSTLPAGADVRFAWNDVKGAQKYRLHIEPDARTIETSSEPAMNVSNLAAGIHRWRTQAFVDGEWRPWTGWYPFSVEGTTDVPGNENAAGNQKAALSSLSPALAMQRDAFERWLLTLTSYTIHDVNGCVIEGPGSVAVPSVVAVTASDRRSLILIHD